MANKFILLLILLSSCRGGMQKVEVNYDYKYVSVENQMFFIERIKIFNSIGNTLYEQKLNSDKLGLSKVFLFQNHIQYVEKGSVEIVKNDTLEQHIQVEIHSRDMQTIEMFEDRFKIDNQGIKIIEAIKESYP